MDKNALKHYEKGQRLAKKGKFTAAITEYRNCIKIAPEFFEALNNLGNLLLKVNLNSESIRYLTQALELEPKHPLLLNNLANAYIVDEQPERAFDLLITAQKIDPHSLNIYLNLILVCYLLNDNERLENLIKNATGSTFDPFIIFLFYLDISSNGHNLIGQKHIDSFLIHKIQLIKKMGISAEEVVNSLQEKLPDKCLASNFALFALHKGYDNFSRRIVDKLENALCHKNILKYEAMYALKVLGDLSLSKSFYLKLIKIDADNFDALIGLYDIAYWEGNKTDSERIHEQLKALKISVKNLVTATYHLHQHNFKDGWLEYAKLPKLDIPQGYLDLNVFPIMGKKINLILDQGIGDQVMFSHNIEKLLNDSPKGLAVYLDKRLIDTYKRSFPDMVTFHPRDEKLEGTLNFKLYGSQLPSEYNTSLQSFDGSPYLVTDTQLTEFWKIKLQSLPGKLSVGFAWKGGSALYAHNAKNKSCSLNDFSSLFEMFRGINWITLQHGDVTDEIRELQNSFDNVFSFVEADPIKQLDDHLALINSLDLIVQISNASIHFAGAIGTKALCLLNSPNDFRWFDGKTKHSTPWYNSVELWKKETQTSWESFISSSISNRLQELLPNLYNS